MMRTLQASKGSLHSIFKLYENKDFFSIFFHRHASFLLLMRISVRWCIGYSELGVDYT